MIKEKKCKGQGKAIGYGCGKMMNVNNRIFGLGKMCGCYSDWLLNSEQGKIIMAKSVLKVTALRLSYENFESNHKYQNKLKLAKNVTKTFVHAFVRERDKNKPCISCLCQWNDKFQCGHFFKAETFETLKYNLHNLNGQCQQCNLRKDGNVQNYALNLPNRIGKENYDNLVKLAEVDKHFQKVWDLEKLAEIRKEIKTLKLKL